MGLLWPVNLRSQGGCKVTWGSVDQSGRAFPRKPKLPNDKLLVQERIQTHSKALYVVPYG